jgi:O-antigen ligase
MARALDTLSSHVKFLTDTRAAASLGWRTNVWVHTLDIYLDRSPSVEAKARAMSAALAGAQYGDVVALNGAPGSRAPGGWWYRLMGSGPESQVFTLATSTSADIRAVQGDISCDRAHNVLLGVLITTGAIGLVAWAINLGAAFVLAWRLRRRV